MKYIESICDYLKIKDSSTRKKVRDMIDPLRSFAYVPSVGGYHSVGADEQPDDVNEFNFFSPRGMFHDAKYNDVFPAEDLVNDCLCEAVRQSLNSDDDIPMTDRLVSLMSNSRFEYVQTDDETKYLIHVISGENSYLRAKKSNILTEFEFGNCFSDDEWKTEFTKKEIEDLKQNSDLDGINWNGVGLELYEKVIIN